MRLKNKVAIITGAGSGQGRAAALIFSTQGARIAVSDWKPELGEETVTLVKKAGGEAIFIRTDVSESADCRTWCEPRSALTAGSTFSTTTPG